MSKIDVAIANQNAEVKERIQKIARYFHIQHTAEFEVQVTGLLLLAEGLLDPALTQTKGDKDE